MPITRIRFDLVESCEVDTFQSPTFPSLSNEEIALRCSLLVENIGRDHSLSLVLARMLNPPSNPTLILYAGLQPKGTFPLGEGITSIGRSPENHIVLEDVSVSRRHAEIERLRDGITIRDLDSRNGVHLNGVPRKTAVLHPGDRIRVGKVELQFAAGFVKPIAPPARKTETVDPVAPLDETQKHRAALPDARQDRHLAALYHLCFRATEGASAADAGQQLLDLLLEGVRAQVAQFYSPDGELAFNAEAEKSKGVPKFAAYLLEKFQKLSESRPYTGAELGGFQKNLGSWHYLVAPLRSPTSGNSAPAPIVVLLRSSEWQEFSIEDRTLLNAAARLWPASQGVASSSSTPPLSSTVSAPPITVPSAYVSEASARTLENAKTMRPGRVALRPEAGSSSPDQALGLLGDSPVMQQLRARLDRVAAIKITVLITGETGCGKEVVAQYLHYRSPRAKAPFIRVNCGAIPAALMESELFGHAKGAFTDARSDQPGKFQLADRGTIFLDEIGELPVQVQAKLLRVLESGEVEKVGGGVGKKVDVRIVAATNRDLRARVREGEFREDLLYRLAVAPISVPPLRDHAEDVPVLARHFLKLFCAENSLPSIDFTIDALTALQSHRWPGNVRELRNVIQRVATEAPGPDIATDDVQRALT